MATKPTNTKPTEMPEGGLGWDAPIDPTKTGGKFGVLPEGDAVAIVTKLERKRQEFGKFGTINVAVLTIGLRSDVDESETEIQLYLGLHSDLAWKITAFFTALGQRRHGDSGLFCPDWTKVEGDTFACAVKQRKFHKKGDADGVNSGVGNEIDKFYTPEEWEAKQKADAGDDNLKM
jgi:hypothetical protein